MHDDKQAPVTSNRVSSTSLANKALKEEGGKVGRGVWCVRLVCVARV